MVFALAAPFVCALAYAAGSFFACTFEKKSGNSNGLITNGLFVESSCLNLGEVWETPNHYVRFLVTNKSSQVREIKQFAVSCDCIAVHPASLRLEPGASQEIEVHLDLTHRQPYQLGLERWPIAVEVRPVFEGSFASSSGWTITGVVRSRLSLETPRLAFGDQCHHRGTGVTRRVMAKAHVPLLRVEATAPAELAAVQVDEAPESLGEYRILISPRPDLPVGPFQFEVQVRAVTPDGAIHPCAAIEVSGEMQATTRVFPKVILLENRHLGEEVACQVNLTLASKD